MNPKTKNINEYNLEKLLTKLPKKIINILKIKNNKTVFKWLSLNLFKIL